MSMVVFVYPPAGTIIALVYSGNSNMLQEKMDTVVSVCATGSLSDTHTHTVLCLIKWECRFIVGSQDTDAELQDSHNVSCRPDSSVLNSMCSVCPKVPRPL